MRKRRNVEKFNDEQNVQNVSKKTSYNGHFEAFFVVNYLI